MSRPRLNASLVGISTVLMFCMSSATVQAAEPTAADPPKVNVVINKNMTTPTKLVLDITLPGKAYTQLLTYRGPNGTDFTKVLMPGLTTSFDPTKSLTAGLGRPGVPALSVPFAIPESASGDGTANIITQVTNASFDDVTLPRDLFPASTQPLDSVPTATQLVVGHEHACALISDGTVNCWGSNGHGQLGSGTIGKRYLGPVRVNGLIGAVQLVAGWDYTCALLLEGTVRCWGDASDGTLGPRAPINSNDGDSAAPFTVTGVSGAARLSSQTSDRNYICALLKSGKVTCWGSGSAASGLGQSSTPQEVNGIANAVDVFANGDHSCALLKTGSVSCWGSNEFGQINSFSSLSGITKISGHTWSCALASSRLHCQGDDTYYDPSGHQSGRAHALTQIGTDTDIVDIAASRSSQCYARSGGTVACFGWNNSDMTSGVGIFGDSLVPFSTSPVEVAGVVGAAKVGVGNKFACLLTAGGEVKCWGLNVNGELGDGTRNPSATPVDVNLLADPNTGADSGPSADSGAATTEVTTGRLSSTCSVLLLTSKLDCWGNDDVNASPGPNFGQARNAIKSWLLDPPNPTAVALADRIKGGLWRHVAIGSDGTGVSGQGLIPSNEGCLIGDASEDTTDGIPLNRLLCFATGSSSTPPMLGVGTATGQTPPWDVKQVGASNVGSPGSGLEATEFCFLRNKGTVNLPAGKTAGKGEIDCFGRDTAAKDWTSPPLTDPLTGSAAWFTQLSVGWGHACALMNTGHARCWGQDWTSSRASVPTSLPLLTKVAAGLNVDCGIVAATSKITCWPLGSTGTTNLAAWPIPAAIASSEIIDISLGSTSACVIKTNYSVACFPFDNASSVAGKPQTLNLPLTLRNGSFKRVSTGFGHACAVTLADKVSCWGANDHGQTDQSDLVNLPATWSDPVFNDFVSKPLYEGMPAELLRPFVVVPDAYDEGAAVPAATIDRQGGPITGKNTLVKADQVSTDEGDSARLRGLGLGQLYVYGGQYTADSRQLRVFKKLRVVIRFENAEVNQSGKAVYGSPDVAGQGDPFRKLYSSVLVNASIALSNLSQPPVARRSPKPSVAALGSPQCGEEMLVIAPREFASAAERFAAGKNAQGMLTKVAFVEDVGGKDPDAIRNFVQGEFDKTSSDTGAACLTPAYLTLLGNTAYIPTFSGDANTPGTPGDIDYSLPTKNTYVPDLAVGRLPASKGPEALAMVDKILAYETAAPSATPAFYSNVTITSFFQNPDPRAAADQRGFVRSSEQLRAGLIKKGAGLPSKVVERLYSTSNPTGTTKLLKDDLGRALPPELQKPQNQAPWNAGTQRSVLTSIQAGRFLLVSRDHGNFDRIFNPAFGSFAPDGDRPAVERMANGSALPVAWLIACLAGRFDDPTAPSFAEAMLSKQGGGMAGVLAASRVSPSEPNNSLLLALGDAIWPSILPTGGKSPIYRMGDVMNAAKLQVLMSGGPSASVDINNEMRLYNWFGDPSMQLWTFQPRVLPVTLSSPSVTDSAVTAKLSSTAADGSIAVLLGADNRPIGKATVAAGSVTVRPANGIASTGSLKLVVVKDQWLPTTLQVRG